MNDQLNDPTVFLLKRVQTLERENENLQELVEILRDQLDWALSDLEEAENA